jgi:prostaglandin-H2 D-isomerase / glutathione transferase
MGCGESKNNVNNVSSSSSIVLHYFDINGRGEIIRMILHYNGASFTDHRVTQDKWPELKSTGLAEFGGLPVVEIDGHRLCESRAIARYLCRKFGYYPSNLADSYWVESLCDVKEGIYGDVLGLMFKKDMEGVQKFYTEDFPWWLEKIEARLNRNNNGNGWFVGNSVTLADFEIFMLVWECFLRNEMKGKFEAILSRSAPKVHAWARRFLNSSEGLKAYLDYRPSRPI